MRLGSISFRSTASRWAVVLFCFSTYSRRRSSRLFGFGMFSLIGMLQPLTVLSVVKQTLVVRLWRFARGVQITYFVALTYLCDFVSLDRVHCFSKLRKFLDATNGSGNFDDAAFLTDHRSLLLFDTDGQPVVCTTRTSL
jgi:hypothetical protein